MAVAEASLAPTAERTTSSASEVGPAARASNAVSPTAAVLRGALALLSTQPLTWAASLASTIVIPHYLGDRGLGQYAIVFTLATLAGTVVSLGVPNYLVRRIATSPAHSGVEPGAALMLLSTVATAAAVIISVGVAVLGLPVADPVLMQLALAGMVVTSAQNALYAALNGAGRHARFAWLSGVGVVLSTTAGIGMLVLGGGVVGYMLASVLSSAAVTALSWWLCGFRLPRAALDSRLWLDLIRNGLPFMGWNVAIQIRAQVVIVVSALLLPVQVAGWLSAAYRIISIPVFIPTAIVTPLLPVLSRHWDSQQEFQRVVQRSLITVLILIVPISASIMALAPAVPDLLHWGPAFYPAVPVMMLLSFQQPLVAVDMVLGTALVALRQERLWLRVAVVAAILNPAANFLVLPLFDTWFQNGAIGAAVVELATECLMMCWALVLLPPGFIIRTTLHQIGRVLLAGLLMAVVSGALRETSTVLAAIAGAATYGGAAAALGLIRPADLLSVRSLVSSARDRLK